MVFDVNNDVHAIVALLVIAAIAFAIDQSGVIVFALGLIAMILYGRVKENRNKS